jgi:hypothetical protein
LGWNECDGVEGLGHDNIGWNGCDGEIFMAQEQTLVRGEGCGDSNFVNIVC